MSNCTDSIHDAGRVPCSASTHGGGGDMWVGERGWGQCKKSSQQHQPPLAPLLLVLLVVLLCR